MAILLVSLLTAITDAKEGNLAFACSCGSIPPEERFADATVVLSGKVIDVRPVPSEDSNAVTLNVSSVWKSEEDNPVKTGETIVLQTSKDSGLCGYPFETEHDYLVYTYSKDTPIEVGLCGGTQRLESANIDLLYLTTGVSFGHQGDKTFNIMTDDGKQYPLTYNIIGGNITSVTIDQETKSLILLISPIAVPQTDGALQDEFDSIERTLMLKLPRNIIDAQVNHPKLGEIDVEYAVMTFEKEGMVSHPFHAFSPVGTPEERWIEIPFNETTDMIRVTGTTVIPEFGSSSAALVGAVTIAAVVLVAFRSLKPQMKK